MSFLELRSVERRYGRVAALGGIDLDVKTGSRTAIVGPSGCGKTTLLRLVAGFDVPDAGTILMDGKVIANASGTVPAHRREIGVVAQDGALFPHLTIAENIGFGIDRNAPGREKMISDLAYTVGLDGHILLRRPHQLSGGQQQRVALARAMARKPKMMLLDEPFSALDTGLRASMRKAVAEVLENAGITTILVTHDQAEALSFADQVAVMREGRFAQVGTPRELYLKPKNRMVAESLGDAIVLSATIADGWAECSLGRLSVDTTERRDIARILLRPEQISLRSASSTDVAAAKPGAIFAEVSDAEFAGAISTVAVKLLNNPDSPELAAIGNTPLILKKPSVESPAVGEIVQVAVSGKAHILE
ncbi:MULTISPECIES: ABC transporter ATP-binding protein [Mesorhizobium]|uniref:ABC transporter ATP-binding protein n=1 Tax=Mesorhizobium denitrificans TaxID=2294114 RepID=A0A371XHF0_9HYPH|nr:MULTISPECIES: ABC transporter ATP-binding protein [Mesorhizobium]RFC68649.1 ABC transporter ATP-binding protein [Mesorhizobium denitrificans]